MIITTITVEETPQIAKILQDAIQEIKKLSPKVRVEYTNHELSIPTDETLNDLKNAKSLQYTSHNELIDELMAEIKAEK